MLLIGRVLFTEEPRSDSPIQKPRIFGQSNLFQRHRSEMRLPLFPRADQIPLPDANLILGYDRLTGLFVMVSGVHLRLWRREVEWRGRE